MISIGIISAVLSGYTTSHDSNTKEEILNSNQSGNLITAKHFSVDLNESVGIAAHP